MKDNCEIEKQFLIEKLLKIPVIESCECIGTDGNEFRILIQYDGGTERSIRVCTYNSVSPMYLKRVAEEIEVQVNNKYTIIMAPYISEKAEKICVENGMGYVDLSGNMYISVGTIYISEKGNPNKYSKKRKSDNLFRASSTTTSLLIRKLLEDPKKPWKLKKLAEEVGCSIGMVSRVKDKLCDELWAEMTREGLRLIDPQGLLVSWSQEYQHTTANMIICYTLDTIPTFEKRVKEIHNEHEIDCCLTGLAGGVRYTPVVRYNRVHVLVNATALQDFIKISGCKEVSSGANVVLIAAQEDQLKGCREINGDLVASPVQVFLDCMQIKGRGAEMADAIFEKEIRK